MMKTVRFYWVLVAMFLPLSSWAQQKLFDKYCDMKEVRSVYISKTMLEMNANLFTNDLYVGKTKNLTSVRILTTRDNKVRKEMLEDIRSMLSQYELLMKQKSNHSSSAFYIARNRKNDRISKLIMVMNGASLLRFIYLEGDMTPEDVKNIFMYQNTSSSVHISYIPDLGNLHVLESLENLKGLEGLSGLESLKDLEQLAGSDVWEKLDEHMGDLQEYMKDLNMRISKL